eukprot:scaffold216393_cov23-Prasinocladus_malaysianus.AAC.1
MQYNMAQAPAVVVIVAGAAEWQPVEAAWNPYEVCSSIALLIGLSGLKMPRLVSMPPNAINATSLDR